MTTSAHDMDILVKTIRILEKDTYTPPPFISEDSETFPFRADTFFLDRSLLPCMGVNMVRIISGMPGGSYESYLGRHEGDGMMYELPVNGSVKRSLVEMALSYKG